MKIYIQNKEYNVDSKQSKGQGGEAECFILQNGDIAKIYKDHKHQSFAFDDNEQKNADIRLQTAQKKLPELMKIKLPPGIVQPKYLIHNNKKQIIGYTMDFIDNAEMLSKYSKDRKFRQSINSNQIVEIFKNLHPIVDNTHKVGVIMGDFNDTNVMVEMNGRPHIIDIDSSQFLNFICNMYTDTFVDPLLCDKNATGKGIMLVKPHNENSDWYAFAVMMLRNFLLIHSPFAGVYNPKNKPKIPDSLRSLERITIFDPDVKYPGNSIHYDVLPDEFLQYFEDTFVKDKRDVVPLNLLEKIRWTQCANCGSEHARGVCPNCAVAAPAVKTVVRGSVTATNVFRTSGRIVASSYQQGNLQWIYHENGKFRRNGNIEIIPGDLDPQLVFKICGNKNVFAKKNKMVVLESNEVPVQIDIDYIGSDPLFAANAFHYFWISDGKIYKDYLFDSHKYIGDVLEGQSRFWVSDSLGFGFYRAGGLFQPFIIDVVNSGINDNITLPPITGHLLDYDCFFGKNKIWFMITVKEGSKDLNKAYIIDDKGSVLSSCAEDAGGGSWLGENIHGKLVAGDGLFSATDNGIVKVDENGQVVREFVDTNGMVNSGDYLYPAKDGIYVVDGQTVRMLQIK